MDMSITEAKAKLAELVSRAEAGEEVFLTRDGMPVARISPVATRHRKTPDELDAIIRDIQAEVAARGLAWPNQTSNHDYLYDENGLPA
jgi:prevent-host-death family protein